MCACLYALLVNICRQKGIIDVASHSRGEVYIYESVSPLTYVHIRACKFYHVSFKRRGIYLSPLTYVHVHALNCYQVSRRRKD